MSSLFILRTRKKIQNISIQNQYLEKQNRLYAHCMGCRKCIVTRNIVQYIHVRMHATQNNITCTYVYARDAKYTTHILHTASRRDIPAQAPKCKYTSKFEIYHTPKSLND